MTASPLDPPLSLFLVAGSEAQCPGKRFAQRPRGPGLGRARRPLARPRPGAPALSCFVCPGSRFHFYRKGFPLPLTKLVFSCLIRERVRHTMSSRTRMWRQVQRRDSAHASLPAGRLLPRTFFEKGLCLQPKVLLLGPLQGLAVEAWLSHRTRNFASSLLQACPPKSLTFKGCDATAFPLAGSFLPRRINNLHFL